MRLNQKRLYVWSVRVWFAESGFFTGETDKKCACACIVYSWAVVPTKLNINESLYCRTMLTIVVYCVSFKNEERERYIL